MLFSYILGINTNKLPNDIDILFYYNYNFDVGLGHSCLRETFKRQLRVIFRDEIEFIYVEILDYIIDEKIPKVKVIFMKNT